MTQEEILQLKRDYEELKLKVDKLYSSSTIPFDVDSAFTTRLSKTFAKLETVPTATKSATSEGQSVNEAGAATYSVLKNPDAFLKVKIKNTIYYLPYYT